MDEGLEEGVDRLVPCEGEGVAETIVDDVDHLGGLVIAGIFYLEGVFIIEREDVFMGFAGEDFEDGAHEGNIGFRHGDGDETDFGGVMRGGDIGFLEFVELRVGDDTDLVFGGTEGVAFEGTELLVADDEDIAGGKLVHNACLVIVPEGKCAGALAVPEFVDLIAHQHGTFVVHGDDRVAVFAAGYILCTVGDEERDTRSPVLEDGEAEHIADILFTVAVEVEVSAVHEFDHFIHRPFAVEDDFVEIIAVAVEVGVQIFVINETVAGTEGVDDEVPCHHEGIAFLERDVFHEISVPVGLGEVEIFALVGGMEHAFDGQTGQAVKVIDDEVIAVGTCHDVGAYVVLHTVIAVIDLREFHVDVQHFGDGGISFERGVTGCFPGQFFRAFDQEVRGNEGSGSVVRTGVDAEALAVVVEVCERIGCFRFFHDFDGFGGGGVSCCGVGFFRGCTAGDAAAAQDRCEKNEEKAFYAVHEESSLF